MLWITEYDETKDRELFRQDCLEEGRAEGFSEGLAEGKAEGMAEEAERMSSLMLKLKDLNRVEDVFKAASDPSYLQKLYKEFNL